jgi:EutQ-like cupin domain
MRKMNIIIVLVVVAIELLTTSLALGQAGNPPASTKESGATSGKGMTSVERTAEGSGDPSRFTYLRLYCAPDGNWHFQNVTGELRKTNFAPPAPPLYIGGNVPVASVFFGKFEAGWGAHDLETSLYHPAPAAQFLIVLEGVFSVTATDGETRRFRPGDVFRLEDTPPCKGHITVVGDTPGYLMFAR